jgi:hypothetical protein
MKSTGYVLILVAGCVLVNLMAQDAGAQDVGGREYYAYSIDIRTGMLQHCTLAFGDSGDNATSGDSGDNATSGDGALPASGALDISLESETFDTASGSYLLSGRLFNGTWEASQSEFSAYYGETVFTYYSFLIAGLSFGNSFFVGGLMNTTITEVSQARGTLKSSAAVPFMGVLVSIPE